MMVHTAPASVVGVPLRGACWRSSSSHCSPATPAGDSGIATSATPAGTLRRLLLSSILPTKQARDSLCSRM